MNLNLPCDPFVLGCETALFPWSYGSFHTLVLNSELTLANKVTDLLLYSRAYAVIMRIQY